MTNSDDELIHKIAAAVIQKLGFMWDQLTEPQRDAWRSDIRTILAVVREHDAPKPSTAPKRVVVQINMDSEDCLFALANDGTIHVGWYASGEFSWKKQIPPLPQQDNAT